ncbi:hypothetical protein U0070_021808, partial [Myodes glareolus]
PRKEKTTAAEILSWLEGLAHTLHLLFQKDSILKKKSTQLLNQGGEGKGESVLLLSQNHLVVTGTLTQLVNVILPKHVTEMLSILARHHQSGQWLTTCASTKFLCVEDTRNWYLKLKKKILKPFTGVYFKKMVLRKPRCQGAEVFDMDRMNAR